MARASLGADRVLKAVLFKTPACTCESHRRNTIFATLKGEGYPRVPQRGLLCVLQRCCHFEYLFLAVN
ncbi:hypothetical protein M413DRAFT_442771 [Hebeloma cylindrosporum]|uniref:Uncharacterized protein n=1 Tax=Hebeloma cylindrosporum TaxID=76867 RepID=A0A0C2YUW6_HEBCY|nr:hypothetical protein M413DRAFT_442771 [Hebeloma cylindrosporum h7]